MFGCTVHSGVSCVAMLVPGVTNVTVFISGVCGGEGRGEVFLSCIC